jgi:hypothetical protein
MAISSTTGSRGIRRPRPFFRDSYRGPVADRGGRQHEYDQARLQDIQVISSRGEVKRRRRFRQYLGTHVVQSLISSSRPYTGPFSME